MNFKDLYKAANDNISADKKIIDEIYAKADRKTSVFSINYRQIALCAAALFLIFTLTAIPYVYDSPSSSDEGNNIILKKDDMSGKKTETHKVKSSDTSKNTITEKAVDTKRKNDKTFKNTTVEESTDISDVSDMAIVSKEIDKTDDNSVSDSRGKVYVPDDNQISSSDNKVSVAREAPDMINESSPVISSARSSYDDISKRSSNSDNSSSEKSSVSSGGRVTSGGGSGGSSGGSSSYAFSNFRVDLSINDYADYLGVDMSEIDVELPDGMSFSVPEQVSVVRDTAGNKYVYDDVQFIATDSHNPQKTISVSTTKLDGDAKRLLENTALTKRKINNYDCVFINDDTLRQAYFKYDDVWVTVLAVNILDDEFEVFIYSLLK